MEFRSCFGFVIIVSLFIPIQTQRRIILKEKVEKDIILPLAAKKAPRQQETRQQETTISISNGIPTCPYGEPLIHQECYADHQCPGGYECNRFTGRCCPSYPDDICDRGELRKGKCGPKDYPCPCGYRCRNHPAKGYVVCCPDDCHCQRECKYGYPLENRACGKACPNGYGCNNHRCCPIKSMPVPCTSVEADIVFVLDESGSIGKANFDKLIDMTKEMVQSFDIASDKVRVGVLTFSSSTTMEFHLDAHNNQAAVLNAFDSIVYNGGSTRTYLALDRVVDEMFANGNGNRPNVKDFTIVITDGGSNNEALTTTAAHRLHDDDIVTFSIGIGSHLRESELDAIANDPDSAYSLRSPNFEALANVTERIKDIICRTDVQ